MGEEKTDKKRSGSPVPGRPRRWFFRLLAVGFILVIPAVVELALRLHPPAGLAQGPTEQRPNPAGRPYFQIEKSDGISIYTPRSYFRLWGHEFKFIMPKPPLRTRIFTLGDSTANGGAFGNPGAFSKWLAVMLAGVDDRNQYEVINSGQGGFPLVEVEKIEQQVLTAAPDLIIIYCGNNEFSFHREQTPGFRLPPVLQSLSDSLQHWLTVRWILQALPLHQNSAPPYGLDPGQMQAHAAFFLNKYKNNAWDRQHRDEALAQYRSHLETMVKAARDQGVKVVLCTVAVNLRDYTPYGSYHRPDLTAAELADYNQWVASGKAAFLRGDFALARDEFLKAYALDPEPADLNFFIGHAYLRLQAPDQAYPYFQAAVIKDLLRERVGSDLNAIIREIAAAPGVALADVEMSFKARSQDGVPGDDLFVDQVHPTLQGQRLIANTILKAMGEKGWLQPRSTWETIADQAADRYQEKMPPDYLFNSYITAASLNAFIGRFPRARKWAQVALSIEPDRPEARQLLSGLEVILKDYPSDPSPWSEIDLIEKCRQAGKINP